MAIVRALLNSVAHHAADVGSPTEGDLAKFAFGWLSSDDENRVVAALVHSAQLRHRVIALRAKLAVASTEPWKEAFLGGQEPLLEECLREALRSSVDTYADLANACSGSRWSSIVRGANDQAIAVRSALRAIGERILAPPPVRPVATARSPQRSAFEVSVNDDGTLIVEREEFNPARPWALTLREPGGGRLLIADQGEATGTGRIEVPSLGAALGLQSGRQPTECFEIAEADGEPQPIGQIPRGTLYAAVDGSSERIPIDLASQPAIGRGVLRLDLEFPAGARAKFADYEIALSIVVGTARLNLLRVAIRHLQSDEIGLEIPMAGFSDGACQALSVFGLSFIPSSQQA